MLILTIILIYTLFSAPSLLGWGGERLMAQTPGETAWLQPVEFDASQFAQPELRFAPFTRWWWPGNDVTPDELKRELNLFAQNHFGGVEIQPMSLVMPCKGEGRAERIMSYDTPAYYENLQVVMAEAERLGLTVDMTDGSGWPSGGAHITESDNNLTLEYGIADIAPLVKVGKRAPKPTPIRLPRAEKGDRPSAKLISVLAAKVSDASGPTLILDAASVRDITNLVQADSTVTFPVEEEGWRLIALWSVADVEKPSLIATRDAGFAMNHFDTLKIAKNYEHYFGQRTGLAPYMGKTLRCAFNDSYEFRADRHWSDDFIEVFKVNRGYDPTCLLPANICYGYNNMYYRMEHPDARPSFGFGSEDWRLRYDYDLTVSDLLKLHLLDGSRRWFESRGMLHRTQPYGLDMDMMALAGHASIPEMETMQFARASEAGFKIISSGAHLYNRPIVTCESAVYFGRAFLTTPQKLRMTIDKILVSGVNQLIYHGTPYSYFPDGYPKEEGWYPFWNSALGIDFSSMISETSPFWSAQSQVNLYAQRAQYVLRSGKPQADVLIYYPFLKFSEATNNPHELLINGELPVEPAKASSDERPFNADRETAWMEQIYPLLDSLYAQGITWDWVNDETLSQATRNSATLPGGYDVRGNQYRGLILFNLPFIQEPTAQQLSTLAQQGANMLIVGALPTIQPSYKDWEPSDKRTAQAMRSVAANASVTSVANIADAPTWLSKLSLPLRTLSKNVVMRQTRRLLADNALAQFYWNQSYEPQDVRIKVSDLMRHAYWMNAEDGTITEAPLDADHCVTRTFEPLTTAFLYVSATPLKSSLSTPSNLSNPSTLSNPSNPSNPSNLSNPSNSTGSFRTLTLGTADITIDTLHLANHSIGDWRNDDQLKYEGREATYTLHFNIDKKDLKRASQVMLDLGNVFYTAEVNVNGQDAGSLIWTPYRIDITPYVHRGDNVLSIRITPSRFNSYVRRGLNKDRLFKALKDSGLAAQGLAGPVKIILF